MANKLTDPAWVLKELKMLSVFLDSKFRLPGGFRIGWDAIFGVIPGVGPLMTTAVSFYIILRAMTIKSSYYLLAHMTVNVFIDLIISLVPFLGFIVDIFWKSNLKNIKLLEKSLLDPVGTAKSSKNQLIIILLIILALFIFTLCVVFWFVTAIFTLIINNI